MAVDPARPAAIATSDPPAAADKIKRQRSATCCGVEKADAHCVSCCWSAADKVTG